jgi:HD-like signal output (HDOD) protein
MGWLSKRKDKQPASPQQTAVGTQTDYRHPVLDALPERWRGAVLATGHLRKFGAGDSIEIPGADSHLLCLILKGQITQVSAGDRVDTLATVDAGGHLWIQPVDETGTSVKPLARGTVAVLLLDPEGLKTLPEEHQLTVHRTLLKQTRSQQREIVSHQLDTARRERQARTAVVNMLEQQRRLTAKSDMVTKVLASAPQLPMYAHQLISMLSDGTSSVSSVVETAQRDPSLAADVMKTINSPYYALSNKVSDLQHAVVLLGFDQIHRLVMAKGVNATMPDTPETRELLLTANVISFISMEIARMGGFKKPVVMSTIALLHQVGQCMSLLLKNQFKNLASFIDLLDSPTIGAMLLESWELPEEICATVGHQHRPHHLPPGDVAEGCRQQVAALYLSQLCYRVLRGANPATLPTQYLGQYQALLGLNEEPIQDFITARLLPALAAKRQSHPETMRRFFSACEGRLLARS